MLIAWAAMAGAVMTKGLIGLVIPAGALFFYTPLTRDFAVWRRLQLVLGPLLLHRAVGTVVRAGFKSQSRVCAVLLHPRAFPALSHDRASPQRRVVVLRPALDHRIVAVGRHVRPDGNPRLARRATRCQRLRLAALLPRLDRLRVPVLQRVGIEAAVVHPAAVPRRGAARRLAARRREAAHAVSPHLAAGVGRVDPARTHVPLLRHAGRPPRGRAHAGARLRELDPFIVAGLATAGLGYSLSALAFRRTRRGTAHLGRRRPVARDDRGAAAHLFRQRRISGHPVGRRRRDRAAKTRPPRPTTPPRRCSRSACTTRRFRSTCSAR